MANHSIVELAQLTANYTDSGDSAQEALTRASVGWTGKNKAYSQTNNAVIAHIENGKSYKVAWVGSATITLKKDSSSGTQVATGDTSPLSFTADADYNLYFGSSADVTNIMVYDARIKDSTYEPYHESVEECKLDIADQQVLGAWNLLKNTATTIERNGITWTVNSDLTVTANGTATPADSVLQINNLDTTGLNKYGSNHYYMSGCPKGGADNKYDFYIHPGRHNGSWDNAIIEYGDEIEFDYDGLTSIYVGARVRNGATVNNLVYKPQISLKPNMPYAPHAMTNRELTEVTEVVEVTDQFTIRAGSDAVIRDTSHVYKCGRVISGCLNITTPTTVTNNAAIIDMSDKVIPVNDGGALANLQKSWTGVHDAMIGIANRSLFISGSTWTPNINEMILLNYIARY